MDRQALKTDMPVALREKLQKQGYHLFGKRGAFKACQWQQKSLLTGDSCYKQKFYGIESHRCIQMTPVVDKCTQQCTFCWRVVPSDIGIKWDQVKISAEDVDTPDVLLDGALMANLRSLGGYNPEAGADVEERAYKEAREPKHVAVSLAGEPTLYPMISGLLEEIDRREMTSFLVSNGTRPHTLATMYPPTQLYITLAAPNEKTYRRLCNPIIKDGWDRLEESQEIMNSLSCRKVNRLTMVAGRNMSEPHHYARLIAIGEPDFVEIKGYMFLGSSRDRLESRNAPPHREIRSFSERLSALTGYQLTDQQPESRVVLLSRKRGTKQIQ